MRLILACCIVLLLALAGATASATETAPGTADQDRASLQSLSPSAADPADGPVPQAFGQRRYTIGNAPSNPPVGISVQAPGKATRRSFAFGRTAGTGRAAAWSPFKRSSPFAKRSPFGGFPVNTTEPVTVTPPPTETVPTPTPTPIETVPTPTPTPDTRVDVTAAFVPSGWMGDWSDIVYNARDLTDPHSPSDCIKIIYSGAGTMGNGWTGIYWLYPENNWGTMEQGVDLAGHSRLTFWARGKLGGEKAEFKAGGITGQYPDSLPLVTTGVVTLNREWTQYSIDLTRQDLSHVVGGFCWVAVKDQNPGGCTIYLDDIYYE